MALAHTVHDIDILYPTNNTSCNKELMPVDIMLSDSPNIENLPSQLLVQ